MFNKAINSKKQGDIGLGLAIAHFTSNGYTVSLPLTDSQDYDVLVDDGTKISKVQVKTCSRKLKSGGYEANLSIQGGNQSRSTKKMFDSSKVDLVFIVCENGDKYCIPTFGMLNKCTITVGGKHYSEYKI